MVEGMPEVAETTNTTGIGGDRPLIPILHEAVVTEIDDTDQGPLHLVMVAGINTLGTTETIAEGPESTTDATTTKEGTPLPEVKTGRETAVHPRKFTHISKNVKKELTKTATRSTGTASSGLLRPKP